MNNSNKIPGEYINLPISPEKENLVDHNDKKIEENEKNVINEPSNKDKINTNKNENKDNDIIVVFDINNFQQIPINNIETINIEQIINCDKAKNNELENLKKDLIYPYFQDNNYNANNKNQDQIYIPNMHENKNEFYAYDENGNMYSVDPPHDENYYKQHSELDNIFDNLNSPNKFGIFRKSTMTISDLTDDSKLRKSITFNENLNNYINIQEWDYIKDIDKAILIENQFKDLETIFFEKNRSELYALMEKIKNCNVYYQDKKFDYVPNVGLISTLEYMIESTFGFDKNKYKEIINHFITLDKFIFRWRSISGDGNCYYRAIIFGFLEKIIFEKNILFIKKLIVEIDNIFNNENENLKYLSYEIKTEILAINKNLILKILYLIYEILDNPKNNDSVQLCYEILIKCFNFCVQFDLGMNTYLRYILFDFIKDNKGKLYSKNFAINIGNLLPADFETSTGGKIYYLINFLEFLYDRFFNENLMKCGTDAEKIVIYLTPFVLKTNLKIIIYEFDSESSCMSKDFSCNLEDKSEILVLYRKTHYDLAYSSDFFQNNTKHLSSFVNLDENLSILNIDLLQKIRSNNFDLDNPDFFEIIKNSSNVNNNQVGNLPERINNMNLADKYPQENENSFDINKCENCNSEYIHPRNNLNLCNICLKDELNSNIMASYLIFSTEAFQLYSRGKESNIPIILDNSKDYFLKISYQ